MAKSFKLLGTFKSEFVLEVITQNSEHFFYSASYSCPMHFYLFLKNSRQRSSCLEHKSQSVPPEINVGQWSSAVCYFLLKQSGWSWCLQAMLSESDLGLVSGAKLASVYTCLQKSADTLPDYCNINSSKQNTNCKLS
jgi:hypothetical protein